MLASLITSKTRIKILTRFFLNSDTKGHLRKLASEFDESTNSVRLELNRLENAGMLMSKIDGNKKVFFANTKHPLFQEVQNILRKETGIDEIIERVIKKLGGVSEVYLTGQMAEGLNDSIIDLVLIGEDIDRNYLLNLTKKAEVLIKRKIRTICLQQREMVRWREQWNQKLLLLWSSDNTS